MSDKDATTERIQRRAPRVSEDTWLNIKAGALVAGAVALVTATVWLYQIKLNSEQALAKVEELHADLAPIIEQHRRLWWDYENRTAQRGGMGQVGP